MKNKGFTLVELIVTIAILALIATIAVVAVTQVRNNAESDIDETQQNMLEDAAEQYYVKNFNKDKDKIIVSVQDLIDGGFLKASDVDDANIDRNMQLQVGEDGVSEYDPILLSEKILEDNPANTNKPDFNTVATTDEGIYKDVDEDGETYYFRGAVEDNYVKIGTMDMLWRIVRINGDETIRLVSNETIGTSEFNGAFYGESYVGYTYNKSSPSSQGGTNSTIKTYLENWYRTNMDKYDNLIGTTRYCNDSSVPSPSVRIIYFGGSERLDTNKTPQFTCPETTNTYGGEYNLKIGLLSADEVAFAGGKYGTNNQDFYLYKDSDYWLGTPYNFGGVFSNMFVFSSSYSLSTRSIFNVTCDVVPVINLKSDTLYTSGTGTSSDPYVIG